MWSRPKLGLEEGPGLKRRRLGDHDGLLWHEAAEADQQGHHHELGGVAGLATRDGFGVGGFTFALVLVVRGAVVVRMVLLDVVAQPGA